MALFHPLPIVGIDAVTLTVQASASVQSLAGSAETHITLIQPPLMSLPHGD